MSSGKRMRDVPVPATDVQELKYLFQHGNFEHHTPVSLARQQLNRTPATRSWLAGEFGCQYDRKLPQR
jgi:hypothetical protein